MMVFDRVVRQAPAGTVIPKPFAHSKYRVKGLGKRRGERALIYYIPNRKVASRPHQKGVTVSEFEKAYDRLQVHGQLTRRWFKKALPKCEGEGSCNFTTVGGIFILLGEARYQQGGVYERILR